MLSIATIVKIIFFISLPFLFFTRSFCVILMLLLLIMLSFNVF